MILSKYHGAICWATEDITVITKDETLQHNARGEYGCCFFLIPQLHITFSKNTFAPVKNVVNNLANAVLKPKSLSPINFFLLRNLR